MIPKSYISASSRNTVKYLYLPKHSDHWENPALFVSCTFLHPMRSPWACLLFLVLLWNRMCGHWSTQCLFSPLAIYSQAMFLSVLKDRYQVHCRQSVHEKFSNHTHAQHCYNCYKAIVFSTTCAMNGDERSNILLPSIYIKLNLLMAIMTLGSWDKCSGHLLPVMTQITANRSEHCQKSLFLLAGMIPLLENLPKPNFIIFSVVVYPHCEMDGLSIITTCPLSVTDT